MKNSNLIGIIGKKRVGKDTMADFIIKEYNYVKYSFANPLKEACRYIFQFNDEQLYGNLKETPDARWNNITPRVILQTVGTQLFREDLNIHLPELGNMEDTIWIHNFNLWYGNNKDKKVVIPDVRFLDEAKAIKNNGGILIKIERDNLNNTDLHKSEQELDDIIPDIIIKNDKDISNYLCKINNLFMI